MTGIAGRRIPVAQQVYQLVQTYDIQGQFAANVIHYRFEDGGFNSTFAAANALIQRFIAVCAPAWKLVIPSAVTLKSVKAKRVSAVGGFEALQLYAGGTVGSRGGTLGVAALSPLVIQFEAANGTRRGKVFLPGVTDGDCEFGQLTAAYRTALVAQVGTMFSVLVLTGGGGPTANPVIYHRLTHQGFTISNFGVSLTVGTQRRRQVPV